MMGVCDKSVICAYGKAIAHKNSKSYDCMYKISTVVHHPKPHIYVGGFLAALHPDYELLVTDPGVEHSTFFSDIIAESLSTGSNRGSYTNAHTALWKLRRLSRFM